MFEVEDVDGKRVVPEYLEHAPQTKRKTRSRTKGKNPLDALTGKPKMGRPPMKPEDRKGRKKKPVGRPKMKLTPEPISADFVSPVANFGRPTVYQPWMNQKIIEVAMGGGFQSAMLVACGVAERKTFWNWRQEYPEFNKAFEFAKEISQAFLEKICVDLATGVIEKGNATALALLMNAKYPDEYKRAANGSGGNNTSIVVNTVNMTGAQMDTQIAQKLEKLKALGIQWDGLGENKVVEAEYVQDNSNECDPDTAEYSE